MNIQVISGNKEIECNDKVCVSDYKKPSVLDGFDVNILDLSFQGLWTCESGLHDRIDWNNDLISIEKMISNSTKSLIVFVYPQNIQFKYNYDLEKYRESIDIKDLVNENSSHLAIMKCFPKSITEPDIIFEPTQTMINEKSINADFHFTQVPDDAILTKSINGEKPTTIQCSERIVFTTLDLCLSVESIIGFTNIFLGQDCEETIPEWVNDYSFWDDEEQKKIIEDGIKKVDKIKSEIDSANDHLKKNNFYKSVLFKNEQGLVDVVFEMLEMMLDCDLSQFEDKFKEDFLIEKDDLVFVGEIKGTTSNVKRSFISQLENHFQEYMDEHEIERKNVRALLIVNPMRDINPKQREPVPENQVRLAKRNGSLIVETITLLRLFEMFRMGIISSKQCINLLSSKSGILRIDDFDTREEELYGTR